MAVATPSAGPQTETTRNHAA
ncbi:MAG: hypothetical protein QOF36_18, partial [Microbacteriaceae bacterium]|nr:hypothetical protein [Microbacteriaceae bacterium]